MRRCLEDFLLVLEAELWVVLAGFSDETVALEPGWVSDDCAAWTCGVAAHTAANKMAAKNNEVRRCPTDFYVSLSKMLVKLSIAAIAESFCPGEKHRPPQDCG